MVPARNGASAPSDFSCCSSRCERTGSASVYLPWATRRAAWRRDSSGSTWAASCEAMTKIASTIDLIVCNRAEWKEMLRAFVWFAALTLCAGPAYRQALPGYRYEFPRDHFNHPAYQTEWWYYTGNVHARNGHRYGFELVFFRRGREAAPNPSPWRVDDVYLAHLALTDIDGRKFRYAQRLNRAGPGIAGTVDRS